jgi:hypothetical protein
MQVTNSTEPNPSWENISYLINHKLPHPPPTPFYYYYYGSTAICSASTAFSDFWSYTQLVGPLGQENSLSQDRYLHTEQQKHRINAYNIDHHAFSGIRTHEPSFRASEDSSCLTPCDHRDRPHPLWLNRIFVGKPEGIDHLGAYECTEVEY